MPFTYVVNVYSDMSLSKRHLGSRCSLVADRSRNYGGSGAFFAPYETNNFSLLDMYRLSILYCIPHMSCLYDLSERKRFVLYCIGKIYENRFLAFKHQYRSESVFLT